MRVGLLAVADDDELRVVIPQILEHRLPVGDHGLADYLVDPLLSELLHGLLDRVHRHLLRQDVVHHRDDVLGHVAQVHVLHALLHTRVHIGLHPEGTRHVLRITMQLSVQPYYDVHPFRMKDLNVLVIAAVLVEVVVQRSAESASAAHAYPHDFTSFP